MKRKDTGHFRYCTSLKNNIKSKGMIEHIAILLSFLSILDILNIPSKIYFSVNPYLLIPTIIIGFFIVSKFNFIDYFKIVITTKFDLFLVGFIAATLLYSLRFLCISSFFSIHLYIMLLVIIVMILLIRMILYSNSVSKNGNQVPDNIQTIYDLKDFLDGEFNDNQILFFEERDVSYDLLSRGEIINKLYFAIKMIGFTDKAFTISLTGKWGSGKSTIVNNVIEKLDESEFIIINDFNPWMYANDVQIINSFVDVILDKLDIRFSYVQLSKVVNAIVSTVSAKVSFDGKLVKDSEKYICELKDMINEMTKRNRKQILFIFDNLERTEADSMLTVLKAIVNIFNFKNITYLLVYDDVEMKKMFSDKLNINYDYLEKVVQLHLEVPAVNDTSMKTLISKTLEKLLNVYSVDADRDVRISKVYSVIFDKTTSIRQLKRNLNSFGGFALASNNSLNKLDSFLIGLIREQNNSLYQNIVANSVRYISEDTLFTDEYKYLWNNEEFNADTTKYFSELFENEDNKDWKEVLSLLFPHVEKYLYDYSSENRVHFLNESRYFIENDGKKERHRNSILEKRIFNARFFELYFSFTENNDFLIIGKLVSNFVEVLEKNSNISEINRLYKTILSKYKGDHQKYVLEQLEYHLDSIMNKKVLLEVIFLNIEILNDGVIFLGINSIGRAAVICSQLLKEMDQQEANQYIEELQENFKTLEFTRYVVYWLNPQKEELPENNIYHRVIRHYKKMVKTIVEERINIFSQEVYHTDILRSFVTENDFLKFLGKKLNEDTILYFLIEVIGKSSGSKGYGYKINKEIFEKITTTQNVREILSAKYRGDIPKNNEIVNVFIKYDESTLDVDEGTLYSINELELDRFLG